MLADSVRKATRYRISIVSKTFRTRLHSGGNTILTKTALSAFSIYPKVTWTYKISIHTAFLEIAAKCLAFAASFIKGH